MNCPHIDVNTTLVLLLALLSLSVCVLSILNARNANRAEKLREALRQRTEELHVALRGAVSDRRK